jgi:hypothetical protein
MVDQLDGDPMKRKARLYGKTPTMADLSKMQKAIDPDRAPRARVRVLALCPIEP